MALPKSQANAWLKGYKRKRPAAMPASAREPPEEPVASPFQTTSALQGCPAPRRGGRKRTRVERPFMVRSDDRSLSFSHSKPPVAGLEWETSSSVGESRSADDDVDGDDGDDGDDGPADGQQYVGKRIQFQVRRHYCADDESIRAVAMRETQQGNVVDAAEMLRINRERMFIGNGEGRGKRSLLLDDKLTVGSSVLLVPDSSGSQLVLTVTEYHGWERLPPSTVDLMAEFPSWKWHYTCRKRRGKKDQWWRETWEAIEEETGVMQKISALDLYIGLGYNTAVDAPFMGDRVLLQYPTGTIGAQVVAAPAGDQIWWLLKDDDGERCEKEEREVKVGKDLLMAQALVDEAAAPTNSGSPRAPSVSILKGAGSKGAAASSNQSGGVTGAGPLQGKQLRKTCFLELFSGQCTVSKVARSHFGKNALIVTVDNDEKLKAYANSIPGQNKVHFVQDILEINEAWLKSFLTKIEKEHGVECVSGVWASVCCTNYSSANTATRLCEKGPQLKTADALTEHTLWVLDYLEKHAASRERKMTWVVENPETGRLKDRPFMKELNRNSRDVTYCMYGLSYKKPTRLWSNSLLLQEFQAQFCGKRGCVCANVCPKTGRHQPLPNGSVARSAIPARLPEKVFAVLFQDSWENGGEGHLLVTQLRQAVARSGRDDGSADGQVLRFGGKCYKLTLCDDGMQ
eukprot:SAG31_NODE_2511_length_5585_cov_2.160408_1_plen_685_part_00